MRSFISVILACCAALASGCDKRDERVDLSRFVFIDPGPGVVALHTGSAQMRILVRNVSSQPLRNLHLSLSSEACRAKVAPDEVDELLPGDRTRFTAALSTHAGKAPERYPLELTLRARGLPVAAGIDLMADLRPPADQGWLDVGQVKLVHTASSKSTYYILAAIPLLLLLGWALWRVGRPRAKKPQDAA